MDNNMNFENNEEQNNTNNEVLESGNIINNTVDDVINSNFVARESIDNYVNNDVYEENTMHEESATNSDNNDDINTIQEENMVSDVNYEKENISQKENIAINNNDYNEGNSFNENSNNGLKILIIILIVALLGLLGYFLYDKVLNKDNNNQTNNNTENNTNVVDSNKTDNNRNNDKKASELGYNCKSGKCDMNSIDENIILIIDGINKVLYNDSQSKVIQSFGEEYSVDIISNGLIVTDDNGKKAYYDIALEKYITEFKYANFELLSNNFMIASLFPDGDITDGVYWYDRGSTDTNNECILNDYAIDVISISDGNIVYHKEIHDWKNMDGAKPISISEISDLNEKYSYYLEKNNGHFELLDLDFNLILSIDTVKADYYVAVPTPQILINGTIFMNYGNKFVIYDLNGNEIYKSKEYEQFMEIVNYEDYFAVIENNKVKIIDLTEKIIAEFDDWSSNLTIVSALNFNEQIKSRYSSDEKIYDHKYTDQSIIYNQDNNKWSYLWNIYDKGKTECEINDDGIYIKAIDRTNKNSKAHIYYYNLENGQMKSYEPEDSCIEEQR